MVGLVAMTGVAFVWLWLFAPDNVPERLRKGLMALAAVAFCVSLWSTTSLIEAHRQARLTAKRSYQRAERHRREAADLIRRDQEGLGAVSTAP